MPIQKKILALNLCLVFFTMSIKAQDPHPNPIADFQVGNLCFGGVTSFSNTSTSFLPYPFYNWTILQMGNSVPIYTSAIANINFQFPAKTTYTVSLLVTNYVTALDFHTDFTERVIVVDSFPIANFDFKNCHSRFSNLSCCTNTCVWDFGDGTPTSTVTSPAHTYTTFTNYTVTLIAGNGVISDTSTQIVSPYANTLTGGFNIMYDTDTIRFKSVDDSLKGCFNDWEWDFGDGSTLDIYGTDGWKTKHHYVPAERDSVYKVFLSVKDLCFEAHTEKYVLIKGIGKNVTSTYVFPSPVVHGYLNIESNEKDKLTDIRIIDCQGKQLTGLVPTEKPYGYYIWVGNIAAGAYIVQLVFTNRVENHKIIKE